jgi:restriction endonuclease S subunit
VGPAFHRIFRKGQILYGSRRTYLKKVAVAEFDGITANTTFVLETKDQSVFMQELLPFLMLTDRFTEHSIQESKGSTNPYINWPDIAKFAFPLPPIEEQKRIAEILWAADEAAESWLFVSDRLDAAKQQILRTTFTSDAVLNGKWELMKLKDVATLQTGIAKGRKYSNEEELIELPYLRVANVKDGYLDLGEMKSITVSRSELGRYSVHDGDVLLTEGGDFDKLGRGTVWRGELDYCLHQNHVFCVRPNKGTISPDFLSYQTASPYGKAYFLKCAKKTSNLASINSTQVKDFPVLVAPVEEQRQLLDTMKPIEVNLLQCQEHVSRIRLLIKGYLDSIVSNVNYV